MAVRSQETQILTHVPANMDTDIKSSEAFPDLISAALHGAGISGDDLAFDFDLSDFQDTIEAPAQNGISYVKDESQMPATQILQPTSVVESSSSANIMRQLASHAQQQMRPSMQTIQPMTIINPPNVRQQNIVASNITLPGVVRTLSQTQQGQTVTQAVPQGVQSFRIIRTPTSTARAQTQILQPPIQQTTIRGQAATRHIVQTTSPQVMSSSMLTNGSSVISSGNKNIICIPASMNGNLQQTQVFIQSSNGGGLGSGQVLKVTARGGKAVTTEDITKIVSSLPNLKSGSRIIVNTTTGHLMDPKSSVQLVSKPGTSGLHGGTVLTTPALPSTTSSLLVPNSIISTLKTTAQQMPGQQVVTIPGHQTKISRLPYSPFHKVSQMCTLPGLQSYSSIPTITDMQDINMGHIRMSMSSKELSKAWSDQNTLRRIHSTQSLLRPVHDCQHDDEEIEEEVEELGRAETYADYKPMKLNFGKKHPDAVVETSSLSSVEPPDVKYQLKILDEGVDEGGRLSALQLEAITYACQKHMSFLPNGQRAGYLIGDGAGVGKGRTIAGVIFENYVHRRKRALWLSVSNDLKVDAERDLRDIGASHIDVYPLNKFKYYSKLSSKENNSCKKGVIFATYSSLIGESQAGGKYNTRLKQLLKWLGHDFDGVIVFDECHKAKNLCPTGSSKPTKTGQTVLELQNRLPKARVVYASATGASEPKNMAYMTRLGLWGEGTPFKEFNDFIQAVEKRGVGAMELVAMDAKLRGMYIARQLSFHGVTFRIDEIPLERDFVKVYNLAVEMWVEAREMFQQAAEMLDAEHKMKKTMWGQFWSAHQRFFKYLCISSKVNHCIDLAREAVKNGKCVVIGLQSTGEARTLDQVEESGGELTDFVSTAKGVFQSLVERHFPASAKGRFMHYIKQARNKYKHRNSPDPWKKDDQPANKRQKKGDDSSDPESNESSSDISDIDFVSSSESDNGSDDDGHNPFANGCSSDDDDPWLQRKRKRKDSPKKKKKEKKKKKDSKKKDNDDDDDEQYDKALAKAGLLNKPASNGLDKDSVNWEKACAMKSELLSRIEFLGEKLPPNTLDQLIDELGGPENVAEMTGRKSRVVSTNDGVQFESRSETDVPLEILNLTEKQRFMDGEKCIAIISEAASSGISLQADRRAINQKRRVHITLELPWSADRAIQQFGRTHRSNQVSAPEYVFLISELAGEQRFASTVAKRLESLGALTHGDRRATETRDLSRFNIDNKYGRVALEVVMKSVLDIPHEIHHVPPPKTYQGDFFKDVKEALIGVGMIYADEKTGSCALEKDFNNISKFLNRILGMKVAVQNALFKYFTENLTAVILEAKRKGRWDMGIMDLGSGEEKVRKMETRVFVGNTATNTAKTELSKFAVERGMHWHKALELWRRCGTMDEGFYMSLQDQVCKRVVILVVAQGRNKKKELLYNIYKPNSGLQMRCETLEEIKKKHKKCLPDAAEPLWEDHYIKSETQCSHKYLKGTCSMIARGQNCERGLRTRIYHVLSGSVLSVWSKVETVLSGLSANAARMQLIRLRTEDNQRIVGSIIHPKVIPALERVLGQDSAKSYTEKHNTLFNYQPYIPGGSSSHTNHTSNSSSSGALSSNDTVSNGSSSTPDEQQNEPAELLSMPTLVW